MSETPPTLPPSPEPKGRWTVTRVAIIASGVFIGAVLLCFGSGFVFALTDIDRAGEFIRLIRDIFIIALSMSSILIVIALAVLILQIAGLVNLLQSEIKPLLENLQDTLNTTKGTVKFVGTNVAEPLIKAGSFVAGLTVFTRELGGIRRALRRNGTSNATEIQQTEDGRDA